MPTADTPAKKLGEVPGINVEGYACPLNFVVIAGDEEDTE